MFQLQESSYFGEEGKGKAWMVLWQYLEYFISLKKVKRLMPVQQNIFCFKIADS